jgi:predicted LPLAT superfamily acyltransferase
VGSKAGNNHAPSTNRHHWANIREAGTLAGFRFLGFINRVFGRGIFTLFLYPAIVYFVLARPVARKASLDFLRTHYVMQPDYWSKQPGIFAVIKHFMTFGQSVLDKLLAWTTDINPDQFTFVDRQPIDRLHSDPRGNLIIGSHHGNLEFCRGYMQRAEKKQVNILVHDAHSVNFAEMMSRTNSESRLNIYQVEDLDIALVLKLKNKIENGEWLFIAGDRVPVSGTARTTEVSFMGRTARLPIGPYLLAQSLGCPVYSMFAYRCDDKIKLEVVKLSDKLVVDRNNRDQSLNNFARRYAAELEARCLAEPYQWFNFYDFWHNGSAPDNPVSEG